MIISVVMKVKELNYFELRYLEGSIFLYTYVI